MDFGEAIEALKAGKRVARTGWNGKGMWLALTFAESFSAGDVDHMPRGTVSRVAIREAVDLHKDPPDWGSVRVNAHIDMRTVDGSVAIGWLASQADMLSEDWTILGDDGS